MAYQIDAYLSVPTIDVDELLLAHPLILYDAAIAPELPSGSLRIGGDSPSGLVLVGAAPAARVVDLFDRELRLWVATTTSASDGTYAFAGLSARTQGYDIVVRGVIASGERDVIVPGVQPG